MSILDKANWVPAEHWYRKDDQIAWFDKRIGSWTTYMIDELGHQASDAEYYPNKKALQSAEKSAGGIRIELWEE